MSDNARIPPGARVARGGDGARPSRDTGSPEAELKALALKKGAVVAGIADVAAIEQVAPPGQRPTDLMPEARSVVVAGIEPLLAGAWRTTSPRMMGVMGSYKLKKLKAIAVGIAEHIEAHHQAYAIDYNTYTMASGSWDAALSIKLCALMAGLGTPSLAGGMILHPEWGFLYYSAVITSLPLRADGAMVDPACPAPSCVKVWQATGATPCLSTCPECLSGAIDASGRIEHWRYDRLRCSTRADYTRVGFQKLLLQAMEEPDAEKRKMLLLGTDVTRYVAAIGYATEIAGECFECMRACPVGREHRIKK